MEMQSTNTVRSSVLCDISGRSALQGTDSSLQSSSHLKLSSGECEELLLLYSRDGQPSVKFKMSTLLQPHALLRVYLQQRQKL